MKTEMLDLTEALQVLIKEGADDAVEEVLLLGFNESVEKEIIPLLHSDCTFPDFVNKTYEHAQEHGGIHILIALQRWPDYVKKLKSMLQRVYRTRLEFTEHSVISQLAKQFYLNLYSICSRIRDELDTFGECSI